MRLLLVHLRWRAEARCGLRLRSGGRWSRCPTLPQSCLKVVETAELMLAPPPGPNQSAGAQNGFRGTATRDLVDYSSGDGIFSVQIKAKNLR